MSNSNFLKELHKENSIFMNKAIFGIPAIGAPLVIHAIFNLPDCFVITKVWLFLTLVLFLISVGILLLSFFLSEKAIEELEKAKQSDKKNEHLKKSEKAQNQVKWINISAAVCIVFGFITIIIAIIPII